MNVETITDVGRLERLRERWDELALMRGSPFSTPAWQLAWWREARPSESSLRAIAVFEGDELTALAPFWCARVRGNVTYVSLLAAPAADGIEPLCPPGAEAAAAEAFAAAVDAAVELRIFRNRSGRKARPSVSTMPTKIAARNAPRIEPMPPMTMMTKARIRMFSPIPI